MWKPLAPVALLGKSKAAEASKPNPSKVIQIEAQPLPAVRSRSKPTPAEATVCPYVACMDHDYCLPNNGSSTEEQGKRWNVKQQSFITIKPIKQHAPTTTQRPPTVLASSLQSATNPAVSTRTQDIPQTARLKKRRSDGITGSSVLETPDTSPARQETECALKVRSPSRVPLERSYRRHASSRTPSPRCSPEERNGGRSRKRRPHRSPSPTSSCSESYSSRSRSRSQSPAKKRYVSLSECPVHSVVQHSFEDVLIFLSAFTHFFLLSIGFDLATRIAVPGLHPALPLGPPTLSPAHLPGGGGTLTLLLVLAPGVAPDHGLCPLKDEHSGVGAGDYAGRVHETC